MVAIHFLKCDLRTFADIDFSDSKLANTYDTSTANDSSSSVKPLNVTEPSDLDWKTFFAALSETSGKPAILSLVADHCEPYYIPLVESGSLWQAFSALTINV